jgi:hypothetical protein
MSDLLLLQECRDYLAARELGEPAVRLRRKIEARLAADVRPEPPQEVQEDKQP